MQLFSSMFGGGGGGSFWVPQAPANPERPPSPPLIDNPAVQEARRKEAVALLTKGGRAATLLTGAAYTRNPATRGSQLLTG